MRRGCSGRAAVRASVGRRHEARARSRRAVPSSQTASTAAQRPVTVARQQRRTGPDKEARSQSASQHSQSFHEAWTGVGDVLVDGDSSCVAQWRRTRGIETRV